MGATAKIGMRVRLVYGQHEFGTSGTRLPYMAWCAGRVPVGSTGTLYLREMNQDEKLRMSIGVPVPQNLSIEWDRVKAKERFRFDIGACEGEYLPDYLEATEG